MGDVNWILDTHTLLWWVGDSPRLSGPARAAIASAEGPIFISIVSVWELAVKVRLGRLTVEGPLDTFVEDQLMRNGFSLMPVRVAHAARLCDLPLHHRDPFDRMLICQAQVEDATLISCDRAFGNYDVSVHW